MKAFKSTRNIQFCVLIAVLICSSNELIGQEKYYTKSRDYSDLKNAIQFKHEMDSLDKRVSEISKDMYLFEDSEVIKQNSDSIVYLYNWLYIGAESPLDAELSFNESMAQRERRKKLVGQDVLFERFKSTTENVETLKNLKIEQPTLINFWFTSCLPCVKEIPILNRLKEVYGDRINFLAITFEKRQKVEKFISKKTEFSFLQITDIPHELIRELGVDGYPDFIFVNSNDTIQWFEDGLFDPEKNFMRLSTRIEEELK